MNNPFVLWLGSLISYLACEESMQQMGQMKSTMPERRLDSYPENESEFGDYGYMVQNMNGIALVTIHGRLVTEADFFSMIFGMVGYDELRNALLTAAQTPGIHSILLDIDSPGGAAKGVEDAALVIREINEEMMPVYAFTGGEMNSAAYWLGSSARAVYATKSAQVGSIGALAVHREITKMLAMDGISATVFRSGPNKALGGPFEVLSDRASKEIQADVDSMAGFFMEGVALNRGMTVDAVKKAADGGRTYFGGEAVDAGLIDGILSFDEVVKVIESDHTGANPASPQSLQTGAPTMLRKRVTISAAAQAALASGVPANIVMQGLPAEAPDPADPAAPAAPAPAAPATADPAAPAAPAPAAPAAAVEASSSASIVALVHELSAAKTNVAELTVRLEKANADLAETVPIISGMREIVIEAAQRMQIAMGGAASTFLSSLAPAVLLQQHATIRHDFLKRFPVGGRAEVPASGPEDRTSVGKIVPIHSGAVRATKLLPKEE